MKKLRTIFYVTITCICVLFGSFTVPIVVQAEEGTEIDSRMTYISSYSTSLNISSDGVASVSGIVRGKADVTSSYVKCTLQMSVGGGWADVKSWEVSSTSTGATIAETYQLYSHGTYRVYMVCRANTEEKTGTSAYRTY